jgi:hypothetical protein
MAVGMTTDDDFVTLICPPGAQDAPISEGTTAYTPFPETPGDPRSRWLVCVPQGVAMHLCWNAGFRVLEEKIATMR